MISAFRKVGSISDLKEGGLMRVDVGAKPIVLAKVKDRIYAMDAVCSHEGGPLEEGMLDGYSLKCPWHYAIFDVRNAKVSDQTVWATNLNSYQVQVDKATGDISVSFEVSSEGKQLKQSHEERKNEGAQEDDRKFYEEEERKASRKLGIKLVSKEELEGTDIMTFKFARSELDFSAGQFAYFKLDGVIGDPKGPIRHFSLASSPTEREYLLISTRIRDTPYKKRLASLQIGTEIEAWGPQGEFVLHENYSEPAVFLSGGIGVTPFRSMIKFATDKQLPVRITMFDSNRSQNILFKNEFDGWVARNENLKIIYTVTDDSSSEWPGEKGRINKAMIKRHVGQNDLDKSNFYICGPPAMLKAMQEMLQQQLRIPRERVKAEEFTGY